MESTVGCLKVEVAAERVRDINPDCNVITYPVFYQKQHEAAIFAHKPDYVVDAIDSVAAKLDLIEGCYRAQIPIVSAMGAGNRLDPTRFQVADISKTHTCPGPVSGLNSGKEVSRRESRRCFPMSRP